jgi:hypothetical protein
MSPDIDAARQIGLMDTLAIAPSMSRALRSAVPLLLFLAAVVGLALATLPLGPRTSASIEATVVLAILLAIGPLGIFGFILLWTRNTKLFVGPRYFGYTDVFGRRKVHPLSALRRVLERQVIINGRRPMPVIYLLDFDNHSLFRLGRRAWDSRLVDDFLQRLGIPVESNPAPIKSKDLANELRRLKSS